MSRRCAIALAFTTAAAMAAFPASAATEVSGSVFSTALAGFPGQLPNTDTHADSFTANGRGDVHDLSASALAEQFVNGPRALDSVIASSQISAHWASANRGSVTLPTREWDITSADIADGTAEFNNGESGSPDWTYTFVATGNGAFNLGFDVSGIGEDAGLGSWGLSVVDSNVQVGHFNLTSDFAGADVDRRGAVSQDLIAGHTYTVSLEGDAFSPPVGAGSPTIVGTEVDHFEWTITGDGGLNGGGVPEPATWTLAIVGFGLAGASLRARRRRMAAA